MGQGSSAEQAPSEITSPDVRELILYCQACPDPEPGHVYRVWLGSTARTRIAGEFVPDNGFVGLKIAVDTSQYDEVLITEEPIDQSPTSPSLPGQWSTSLAG